MTQAFEAAVHDVAQSGVALLTPVAEDVFLAQVFYFDDGIGHKIRET